VPVALASLINFLGEFDSHMSHKGAIGKSPRGLLFDSASILREKHN